MSEFIKRGHSGRAFGLVYDSILEDVRLGTTARLVAAWICGRPQNWELRRTHMLKKLGVGKDAWWRARRELMATGYLEVEQARSGGRYTTADLTFNDQPQPKLHQNPTVQGFTELGESEPGRPEPLPIKVLPIQKEQQQNAEVVVFEIQKIHWPAGLTVGQVEACAKVLAGVEPGTRQALVDELAGALVAGKPIANVAGWLAHVASAQTNGSTLARAQGVSAARAARVAAEAREALALAAPPAARAPPTGEQQFSLSAAGRAALVKLAAIRSRSGT